MKLRNRDFTFICLILFLFGNQDIVGQNVRIPSIDEHWKKENLDVREFSSPLYWKSAQVFRVVENDTTPINQEFAYKWGQNGGQPIGILKFETSPERPSTLEYFYQTRFSTREILYSDYDLSEEKWQFKYDEYNEKSHFDGVELMFTRRLSYHPLGTEYDSIITKYYGSPIYNLPGLGFEEGETFSGFPPLKAGETVSITLSDSLVDQQSFFYDEGIPRLTNARLFYLDDLGRITQIDNAYISDTQERILSTRDFFRYSADTVYHESWDYQAPSPMILGKGSFYSSTIDDTTTYVRRLLSIETPSTIVSESIEKKVTYDGEKKVVYSESIVFDENGNGSTQFRTRIEYGPNGVTYISTESLDQIVGFVYTTRVDSLFYYDNGILQRHISREFGPTPQSTNPVLTHSYEYISIFGDYEGIISEMSFKETHTVEPHLNRHHIIKFEITSEQPDDFLIDSPQTVDNEEQIQLPKFKLNDNYPNPFNPTTTISFEIPTTSDVSVEVFSIVGQKVACLYNGVLSSGKHDFAFDGSTLSSGSYLYTVRFNGKVLTKKMVLLK